MHTRHSETRTPQPFSCAPLIPPPLCPSGGTCIQTLRYCFVSPVSVRRLTYRQAAAVTKHSFTLIVSPCIQCCVLQGSGPTQEEEVQEERYPSAVPFLPPLSASTVKYYYQFYAFAVGTIILFGGLLSPALEVNLGLGGTLCMLCCILSIHDVR